MIMRSVRLGFDPEKASLEIRQVFANETARTLWLVIKQRCLTNQNFCRLILKYAPEIDKMKKSGSLNAVSLFRLLSGFARAPMQGVIGPEDFSIAEEIYPFVMGEKFITYEIEL